MTNSILRGAGTGVLALVVALGATVSAQQREFVDAQRANAEALRSYIWKSRTELKLEGEIVNVRLEQVRYDFDGRQQKTQIGGSTPSSEAGGRRAGGPIRNRVVAKKKEEFKELMGDLATLAGSYAQLPPETLKTFAARATITKSQGIDGGSLRVQGRGVLSATDEMTVWIDPAKFMIRRVEVTTALEGKPVFITADYRSLENGLTYQTRSILRYPDKQLDVAIENFDYEFVGRPR